jgi:ABC-2 type transport system permease protein
MNFINYRRHPYFRLVVRVIAVIILASLLSIYHYRVDLTSEKRYTLSDFTKSTLRELDEPVIVNIYLEGDLNIPFHRMKQRLKETLEEFKVYADKRLEYKFINPYAGKDSKATDELLNELVEKGLKPANIIDNDKEGGSVEKLVIPGGLIRYGDTEVPVNLLRNNPGSTADENINSSMESFEYELMRVISSFTADSTEKVAFIEGHGEFNEFQVADISDELRWNFQVDRGRIDGNPGILDEYKAIIIAGPSQAFNEKDKFVLDQYIMKGGKVLWFVDMVNASLDSISSGNAFLAMIKTLNIEDMLFRYGVRLNPVLVQDVQCGMIPVNVALAGNPPDFRPAPWLYSPLLNAPFSSPVTRNLNMIKADFAGSIDTLEARKNVKKTVLLKTSRFSRVVTAPVLISLDEIRLTPNEADFNSYDLPVAVLLDGVFESAFKNRMLQGLFDDTIPELVESGRSTMLVVSDADIIRNEIRPTPQGIQYMPLGFDRYSSQTYGNKEFIVNVVQYITGHTGLIVLRSRELSIRLLDRNKLKNEGRKWVLINIIIPPVLVIVAGLIYNWLRKRRYSTV